VVSLSDVTNILEEVLGHEPTWDQKMVGLQVAAASRRAKDDFETTMEKVRKAVEDVRR
jgi:hypothetical protein